MSYFDVDKQKEMRYLLDAVLSIGEFKWLFDPELLPYLLVINALPDVYTLQSCTGHSVSDQDFTEYMGERQKKGPYAGNLWLRFRGNEPPLCKNLPGKFVTEDLRHPVFSIDFGGKPTGTLHEDMMSIIEWLS
mgnify:CR=1 FL=1